MCAALSLILAEREREREMHLQGERAAYSQEMWYADGMTKCPVV